MNTTVNIRHVPRNQELQGQIVVVIGGSAGIGLETARQASADGAKVILTARSPKSLHRAATEGNAISSMACDATNPGRWGSFPISCQFAVLSSQRMSLRSHHIT